MNKILRKIFMLWKNGVNSIFPLESMLTKTKILIGVLVVGLIGAGVLLVLYIRGTIPPWKPGPPFLGRMIETKGKLEMVKGISPLFTFSNNELKASFAMLGFPAVRWQIFLNENE